MWTHETHRKIKSQQITTNVLCMYLSQYNMSFQSSPKFLYGKWCNFVRRTKLHQLS